MIADHTYQYIESALLFAITIALIVGIAGPQFGFDRPAESVVVYWTRLDKGYKTVPFTASDCEDRYNVNRVGYAFGIIAIILCALLTVCIFPPFSCIRTSIGIVIHPFIRCGVVCLALCASIVSWSCSLSLYSSTLCGTSPSAFPNSGLAWGFTTTVAGFVALLGTTALDLWRVVRHNCNCGCCMSDDDLLDVYIRRHRRFLLQTLNHSKFKDQREPGGDIDEVVRPAIEEYRDAIARLLHAKITILAAPEKDRAAMVAAVATITLSPEALFVQHVHRLMPIQYRDEIIRADAPPPHGMSPFDCDRLHRMVMRQVATARKMVNYGMTAPLRSAMINEYNKFLKLARDQKLNQAPSDFIVPTMAIDVVWHSHMGMNPKHYLNHTAEVCGFVLNHNDEMSDEDLEKQRAATKILWESTFKGELYPSNGKTKVLDKGSAKLDRTEHTNHRTLSSAYGVDGAYCALPIIIMSSCIGFGGCGTAGQSPATCGACGMTTGGGGNDGGTCVGGDAGGTGCGAGGGCGGDAACGAGACGGGGGACGASGCGGDAGCGAGGGDGGGGCAASCGGGGGGGCTTSCGGGGGGCGGGGGGGCGG